MKPLGLVVALASECRSLSPDRIPARTCWPLPGGHFLVSSDAGPEAATAAAKQLVDAGVAGLISWGCAGALAPHLMPGDLILPERIREASGSLLTTDVNWRVSIAQQLAGVMSAQSGDLLESASVVDLPPQKQTLYSATGALAVDMESAAVARVAATQGLPFLAIRSIVDSADFQLPGAVRAGLDAQGKLNARLFMGQLASHPGQIPDLIRLGGHYRAAMQTLKRVHHRLGRDFGLEA